MTRWLEKYISIPFADHGRSVEGCDCWGLVCLVLSDVGVIVPDFIETSAIDGARVKMHIETESIGGDWLEVKDSPKIFDVVTMLGRFVVGGKASIDKCHIGIIAAENKLLHIEKGKNSVLVDLDNPTVKTRIASIYRHKAFV